MNEVLSHSTKGKDYTVVLPDHENWIKKNILMINSITYHYFFPLAEAVLVNPLRKGWTKPSSSIKSLKRPV
jgi:hypothetical protein